MRVDTYIKREAAKRGIYIRPELIARLRCHTYRPENGCLYCGNTTFRYRYYCTAYGKKYYQCEKCRGINIRQVD